MWHLLVFYFKFTTIISSGWNEFDVFQNEKHYNPWRIFLHLEIKIKQGVKM